MDGPVGAGPLKDFEDGPVCRSPAGPRFQGVAFAR